MVNTSIINVQLIYISKKAIINKIFFIFILMNVVRSKNTHVTCCTVLSEEVFLDQELNLYQKFISGLRNFS